MEIEAVPISRLALTFLPVAAVVGVMWLWRMDVGKSLHAIARMLLQLTLVGYVLVYIFNTESVLLVCGVLLVMVVAASTIALNTVAVPARVLWPASIVAVLFGGGTTLTIVTQGVLRLEPWYQPSYIIPLAGMIFASSMTNISLALERTKAELDNGKDFVEARAHRFSRRNDSSHQLLFCRWRDLASRHDDGANTVRSLTAHCGALSDHGDVYDFRRCGPVDRLFPHVNCEIPESREATFLTCTPWSKSATIMLHLQPSRLSFRNMKRRVQSP